MRLELQGYVLDLDIMKTKEYYKHAFLNHCTCAGCKNYRQNIDELNQTIKTFFSDLGITDLNKSIEIIPYYTEKSGMIFYQAIYPICGKIIVEPKPQKTIHIFDDFDLFISNQCILLDQNFPSPAFQITIEARLPWRIDEINTY